MYINKHEYLITGCDEMVFSNKGWSEDIVCLANSRKSSGTCVAGKRISDGSWIRPISSRPGHEVKDHERQFSTGNLADVLDKIRINVLEAKPVLHQSENLLFDAQKQWNHLGKTTWNELLKLIDVGADLWENGHSGYQRHNNKVPADRLAAGLGSLRLIWVSALTLHVEPGFDHMKVRASFDYQKNHYKLDVTDPKYEKIYLERGPGDYRFESLLVCVSLSEIYSRDNCAYKLIATLIPEQRALK